MEENLTLIETTRVSNSKSLRISLPKRISQKLLVDPDDIIGFYLNDDGDIIIKKLS